MKKQITRTLILTLFLTVILFFSSNAQKQMQDVLYLKNGSILHGTITKIKASESITLRSNCGDIWVIAQSDIKKIEKEEITQKPKVLNSNAEISYKRKGLYSNIGIGFLFGGNLESPFPPLSLMFVNGYQFVWGGAIGAGLGVQLLNEVYMPAILELKYTFNNNRVSHFINFQGGYAVSLEAPDPYDYDYYTYYDTDLESKGGFIINPGIGIKLNFNNRNALSFGIGYQYMQVYHTYKEYNGQEIDRTIKYNRISLNFGYHF